MIISHLLNLLANIKALKIIVRPLIKSTIICKYTLNGAISLCIQAQDRLILSLDAHTRSGILCFCI